MNAQPYPIPPRWVLARLRDGLAIPAHPLALTRARRLDERRQRALTRYYHAAGAGGLAVGVHTTQFEIRDRSHQLLKPVLELAHFTINECDARSGRQTVRIAGVCGKTRQAIAEARLAIQCGYHAVLLSMAAFRNDPEEAILEHCRNVAREAPIFGFYLQPAVGGRLLTKDFWRGFSRIPNVVAIKIAAFNRYHTLDVVRAIADTGRAAEVPLYTGNDDNILVDLLSAYEMPGKDERTQIRIVGGLLGHWACWTHTAVKLLALCKRERSRKLLPAHLLALANKVTDCNAAFFDATHQFAGCIAGIHEVLRRQGLLENLVCLDSQQRLSPGQRAEIDRVYKGYPELNDDDFVAQHLDEWLR